MDVAVPQPTSSSFHTVHSQSAVIGVSIHPTTVRSSLPGEEPDFTTMRLFPLVTLTSTFTTLLIDALSCTFPPLSCVLPTDPTFPPAASDFFVPNVPGMLPNSHIKMHAGYLSPPQTFPSLTLQSHPR